MKKYWIEYFTLASGGVKGNGDLVVHAAILDEDAMKKIKAQVLANAQSQDKTVAGLVLTLIQEIDY